LDTSNRAAVVGQSVGDKVALSKQVLSVTA
jgi:hypothetical protein